MQIAAGLHDDDHVHARERNVRRVEPGARVNIHGLEASVQFNGLRGKIVGWAVGAECFEVFLDRSRHFASDLRIRSPALVQGSFLKVFGC